MTISRHRYLIAAAVLATGVANLSAQATELITNGDFETGDFSGWATTGIMLINDGTVSGATLGSHAPINGSYDAFANPPSGVPQSIRQVFNVPAGVTAATASWSDRVFNLHSSHIDPTQEFRVWLEDGVGTPLVELYSTNPGDPLAQPGPNARSVDVTATLQALAGQQAAISFTATDCCYYNHFYVDDVSVLVSSGGGVATWTEYGHGCGAGTGGSVYESFDSNGPFDLAPGDGYLLVPSGDTYIVAPPVGAIVPPTGLGLTFTVSDTRAVWLPWSFPFAHGSTNQVWICSNGWLALEATTSTGHRPLLSELFSGPARVMPLWVDLDPTAGGTIHAEQDPSDPDVFHVTFTDVPERRQISTQVTGHNTFQVSFRRALGVIEVKYGVITVLMPSMIGYSPGHGAVDPGPIDISSISALTLGNDRPALTMTNRGSSRPVLGTPFTIDFENIPPSVTTGLILLSPTQKHDPGIDLTPLGISGCELHVDIDISAPLTVTAPTTSITLPLPAPPSLQGVSFHVQGIFASVPNVEPVPVALTNGGTMFLEAN